MGDRDTIFGWTFQQYLVAAMWMHSKGLSIDYGPDMVIPAIMSKWEQHFDCAPLEGAMQVYNPEIDENVRMTVTISWVRLTMRDARVKEKVHEFREWRNTPWAR